MTIAAANYPAGSFNESEILLQRAGDTLCQTVGCLVVPQRELKSYSKERHERSEEMKGELDPRSEDMCNGIPCLAKACVMKIFATYMAVAVSVVGGNTPSLEKRSIMIRNAVYPSDSSSYSLDEIHTDQVPWSLQNEERLCRMP